MKKALALSKIYINSLYGISRFLGDIKSNRKQALRGFAILIAVIMGAVSAASTFIIMNVELYKAFEPIGQQGIVINTSIVSATIFTMIFGFIGIISTYFMDMEGDIVLSMPFEPWNLLFAKFSTSYILEFLLTLLIMGSGVIVYGVKSGAGVLFYIMYILVAIFIPFIPLVLSYFIIIPLMKVGSIFKKKDVTMIITGFFAMIAILVFQSYFSRTMMDLQQNPEVIMKYFNQRDGIVAIIGRIYPPSAWGTYAITDIASSKGIMGLILLILTAVIATILLHLLMSGLYVQSIIGSGEIKKVTKKYSEEEFKGNLRGRNKLYSMVVREIKLMNREPVFFLNGPFVVILLPVILAITFTIQGNDIGDMLKLILSVKNPEYYGTLAVAGFGSFLGGMASITPSGISREGKTYMFIKSMPIEPIQYINAKLIHGIIFSVFGGIVACGVGSLLLKLEITNLLLAFVISQLVTLPGLIIGMVIELAWPKLIWDNPQKAIKQNMNVVICVLGEMALVFALALLVIKFLSNPLTGYITLIIGPAAISVIFYVFLRKYALRRFYEIEI